MQHGQPHSEDIILPDRLPIFPLRNALLLPGGKLPLNIFEPRYLAMTDFALGAGRLIGMVRPRSDEDPQEELYRVGCAGRISSFMETEDGRYLITLTGVCRFVNREEIRANTPYRMMQVDWEGYRDDDLHLQAEESDQVRSRLLHILSCYLQEAGMKADWESIEGASTHTIVNSVAMSCPFSPDEKQAILEAATGEARAETLVTLMEMSLAEGLAEGTDLDDKPTRLQ